MIETIISGLYTPVEYAAAGFAVDWGLQLRGTTTQEIYQSRQHTCDGVGIAPHPVGPTEMVQGHICDADLVLVLCSAAKPTLHESTVGFSAMLAGSACVCIAPGLDWEAPLKEALRRPGLHSLYLTGGTPTAEPGADDPRVEPLLAAICKLLDPLGHLDPRSSYIPDEDLARCLDDLRRRFPDQFPESLPGAWLNPDRGWIGLLEQLCADIDAALPEAHKPRFYWKQIKEKFGGLRAYWSLGPLFADAMEPKGVTTWRFRQWPEGEDALWQPVDDLIDAAMAASETCCGDCGAPGRRRPRRWMRTLCDLHARPGWKPRQERPT